MTRSYKENKPARQMTHRLEELLSSFLAHWKSRRGTGRSGMPSCRDPWVLEADVAFARRVAEIYGD